MRWQLDFVNRKAELKIVGQSVKDYGRKNAIVFETVGASGFSRFCYEMGGHIRESGSLPVYVDGTNQGGYAIYSSLFETFYKENKKEFTKFLAKHSISEPGSGARHIGAALCVIPGVGDLIGESFKQFSETARTLRHNGYLHEVFIDLLTKHSFNNPLVFFIDDLKALDKWSLDLIDAAAYVGADIKYVFGDIKRKSQTISDDYLIFDKLSAKGYNINEQTFLPPDQKFIQELFFHYGKRISFNEIESISYQCKGNIYRVIAALNGDVIRDGSPTVSHVGQLILKMLSLAGQPLRKSDLISIISGMPDYYLISELELMHEIKNLCSVNQIFENKVPDGDFYLKLVSVSLAREFLEKDSLAQKVFIINSLYEFYDNAWRFSNRHSRSETALLLFRLSKEIDPQRSKSYAVDVIKLSFSLGTFNRAKEYVEQVIDIQKPSNEAEFFSCVTFHIASRNYETALVLLKSEKAKQWSHIRYYRVAQCICEERCRNYEQFDSQLEGLLPSSIKDEEGILRVHQINSFVHRNDIKKADMLFRKSCKNLKKTNSYPYILRTSTSIYDEQRSISYIDEAIEVFKKKENDFGYATSLANKALLLTSLKGYTEALKLIENAKKILQVYGIHHLNILENTLGIVHLQQSMFEKSITHFEKGMQLSNGEMSKFYFSVNLGIADCFLGKFDSAISRLIGHKEFITNYPVDRVRQKYYHNLSSTLLWSDAPEQVVTESIELMKKFPDRKNPQQTLLTADEMMRCLKSRNRNNIMTLNYFSVCHLEYWYNNPLTDLPSQSLPGQTS